MRFGGTRRREKGFPIHMIREMRYLWRYKKNPVIANPVIEGPDGENPVNEATDLGNRVFANRVKHIHRI
jgi:hypothetical protein